MDPCACLQTVVTLPPAGAYRIVFVLGQAIDEMTARTLVERYRVADVEALPRSVEMGRTLGASQVKTPDRALDFC